MKTILIPSALFAATFAAAAEAQVLNQNRNLPPTYRHEHEHDAPNTRRPNRMPDQATQIQQRTDQLANAIENLQEHLEDHIRDGHGGRDLYRLFDQCEAVLLQTVRFRRSVRQNVPPRQIYDQFRALDQQVHGLMQAVQGTNDRVLQRHLAHVTYADERLHAIIATNAGQTTNGFIARQAHVLAAEAQQLERAVRFIIERQDGDDEGRHRGDAELIDAVHRFADRVEHFHETAEHEDDREHLRQDFARLDQSWHQVVELMNRNPHGAYLSRRAQRVGSMHDDLSRVLGVETERRVIRFNVGPFDINLGR